MKEKIKTVKIPKGYKFYKLDNNLKEVKLTFIVPISNKKNV